MSGPYYPIPNTNDLNLLPSRSHVMTPAVLCIVPILLRLCVVLVFDTSWVYNKDTVLLNYLDTVVHIYYCCLIVRQYILRQAV